MIVVSNSSPLIALSAIGLTESGLDRGESETIILSIQLGASLIILDDRDARRYAHKQKLAVIGTVGLLLLAKDREIIPSVKQAMNALKGAGNYIHRALYEEAMKRIRITLLLSQEGLPKQSVGYLTL